MQLSKFSSPDLDVVTLYRSKDESQANLNEGIRQMIEGNKSTLVIGDFNFCYLERTQFPTKKFLSENNFHQLVTEPTHMEGNLIDQAYIQDIRGTLNVKMHIQSRYYTDHKSLHLILKKRVSI